MSSRGRITVALVGLIVLVVVGWLVREYADASSRTPHGRAGALAQGPHRVGDASRAAGMPGSPAIVDLRSDV